MAKNLKQRAAEVAEQARNTTETEVQADGYSSTPEDERTDKKKLISAFVTPQTWEDLKELANLEEVSAGQLVDTAIAEYIERNRDDLNEYRRFKARRAAKKQRQQQGQE